MCGHVGIAGSLDHKDEKMLKRLLFIDYLRGPDATGLAAVRNTGEVKIAKLGSHPIDFFEMPSFKEANSGYQSKVLLGHNRAATKGMKTTFNAHPFRFEHIVGAHNGTLDDSSWKELEEVLGEKYPVDSMAIIAGIAKIGIEETMKHLTGAWSLVWVNLATNTLNFLRNDKRPMWFAYSADGKKLFWGSEWEHLNAANILGGDDKYDLFRTSKGGNFFTTIEDKHYRFDLDKLKAGEQQPPKPIMKELKGKEVKAATAGDPFGRNSAHGNDGPWASNRAKSLLERQQENLERAKQRQLVSLVGDKSDPFGGFISKKDFEILAASGCTFCRAEVVYGDLGILIIEDDQKILCRDCAPGGHKSDNIKILVQSLPAE